MSAKETDRDGSSGGGLVGPDNAATLMHAQLIAVKDLPLCAAAIQRLETLPFKDCMLILEDARIPCHRAKLAEVSNVLR